MSKLAYVPTTSCDPQTAGAKQFSTRGHIWNFMFTTTGALIYIHAHLFARRAAATFHPWIVGMRLALFVRCCATPKQLLPALDTAHNRFSYHDLMASFIAIHALQNMKSHRSTHSPIRRISPQGTSFSVMNLSCILEPKVGWTGVRLPM